VRLHDLIDNGQTEAGTAFKLGLEGLENFRWFEDLPEPVSAKLICQSSPAASRETLRVLPQHGADSVLTEIPETCLIFVAVGQRPVTVA
jgi:hypothetical protein